MKGLNARGVLNLNDGFASSIETRSLVVACAHLAHAQRLQAKYLFLTIRPDSSVNPVGAYDLTIGESECYFLEYEESALVVLPGTDFADSRGKLSLSDLWTDILSCIPIGAYSLASLRHLGRKDKDGNSLYVNILNLVRETGKPLYIAGYSLGGGAACVLAHQLVASGEGVKKVFDFMGYKPFVAKRAYEVVSDFAAVGTEVIKVSSSCNDQLEWVHKMPPGRFKHVYTKPVHLWSHKTRGGWKWTMLSGAEAEEYWNCEGTKVSLFSCIFKLGLNSVLAHSIDRAHEGLVYLDSHHDIAGRLAYMRKHNKERK